jgi:hypothetical protein
VYAIADGVNEGGYHEPELGAEYCEQEPEIPNPELELPVTPTFLAPNKSPNKSRVFSKLSS